MKEAYMLKKREQINVMPQPLGMQLLKTCAYEPMTTKQGAQLLGPQLTKLHHHIETLERAGTITPMTHKKLGTIEKYYNAVARPYLADRKLLEPVRHAEKTMAELQAMAIKTLEDTLSEIHQILGNEAMRLYNKRSLSTVTQSYISLIPKHTEKPSKKSENCRKRASK